jgi:signal transduction histidine kinase
MTLLLLAIVLVSRDENVVFILAYTAVATIYLISFSEIPRFFFDPMVFSGVIHFPLRLFQDLFLLLLFNKFLNHTNILNKRIVYMIVVIYLIPIMLMVIPGIFGKTDIAYHLLIIKVAAPLVALPMGYGLLLSVLIKSKFEKRILVPSSTLLFILQLNDLFNFWKVIETYYTVKFYIPFVICLLIFIYLYRIIQESREKDLLSARNQIVMQVAHDIKSPVAAITTAYECLDNNPEMAKKILEVGVERLNSITKSILPGHNKKVDFDLSEYLETTIQEKNYEIVAEMKTGLRILAKKNDIQRVVSNLLDNAFEANTSGKIYIKSYLDSKKNIISIKDTGNGIPSEVLRNLGKVGNTYGKENGSGLGLSFMVAVMKENDAKFIIDSKSTGTEIKLIFDSIL